MSQMKQVMSIAGGTVGRHSKRAPALPEGEDVALIEQRLADAGVLPLADRVAARWRVKRERLFERDRHPRISAARRELWALLYGSLQPISYPELGYLVGRCHSTVMTQLEKREREVLAGSAA